MTLLAKISRGAVNLGTTFLPQERRIAIDRRLRGKEEFRQLSQADGVIVSFGKSGRTWLRMMISRFYQVRHGLPENCLLQFDNMHRRRPDIPTIFITHDNYLKDFTGHADTKEDYYASRVIFLARHPADVAVSQFFQWKFRMKPRKKMINAYPDGDVSIADFALGEAAGLPKIIDYMNLWAEEAPRIDALHLVRYEDMKTQPDKELAGMLEFLGTPGTDEEIAEAVRFSAFDNMKKMESKRTFWLSGSRMVPKDKNNPQSYKVRRAKVGGYRDYFEDAEIAEIDRIVRERLSPFFRYGDAATDGGEAQALTAEE